MIKEKDLVPGNVITRIEHYMNPSSYERVEMIVSYLIIGFHQEIKRRHKKSRARIESWDTLLLKFGSTTLIRHVFTKNNLSEWKRLGW